MPIDDESYDHDPNPLATAIFAIVDDRMEKFFTSLPAYVVAYDPVRQSVEVQPYIAQPWREESGEIGTLELPMILDLPVLFPGGGKNRITWPIEKGDTVLLICLSQDDTRWKTQGRAVDTGKSFGRHHIQYAMALPSGHSLNGPARPKTDAPMDAMVLHASKKLVAKAVTEIDLTAPILKGEASGEIELVAPVVHLGRAGASDDVVGKSVLQVLMNAISAYVASPAGTSDLSPFAATLKAVLDAANWPHCQSTVKVPAPAP